MKADLKKAQTVLFLDYTGLTVAEATQLRVKMRQAKVGYKVVKNALVRKAMVGTPFESASKYLKGTPTGVVMGFDDPVAAARTTFDFVKTCDHLKIKGGVLDQQAIDARQVEDLSKMPSLIEMKGLLIGMALGPAGKLLGQIKGPAGRIVGAIDTKSKEEGTKA